MPLTILEWEKLNISDCQARCLSYSRITCHLIKLIVELFLHIGILSKVFKLFYPNHTTSTSAEFNLYAGTISANVLNLFIGKFYENSTQTYCLDILLLAEISAGDKALMANRDIFKCKI